MTGKDGLMEDKASESERRTQILAEVIWEYSVSISVVKCLIIEGCERFITGSCLAFYLQM